MIKRDLYTWEVAGCNMCIHKRKNGCAAFPSGIPIVYTSGEFLHEKSINRDNGIVFTPPKNVHLIETQE